jgi:predicted nucleic acid-binding protein
MGQATIPPKVLLDACVLYPAALRDFLMRLAVVGVFDARWTDAIHDEWIGSLLRSRPELKDRLARTRSLMDASVRDSLVSGYERLIADLNLPDEKDRHVLAAAIHAKADIILTFNLRDFPSERLRPYGIEANSPDDFLTLQLGSQLEAVCDAVRRQRSGLKNPPMTASQFLATLASQGMPGTADILRIHIERL